MLQKRPDPPVGMKTILQNQSIFNTLSVLMDMPYAGDGENPRPLPKITIHDFKKHLFLSQKKLNETWHSPDAMYFAFVSDRHNWEAKELITMSPEHLWWMLRSGDIVLLSDRVTHHYTQINQINHEQKRVTFLDPWPERFFLREGLNLMNIKADDKLGISREEFLRVIVGMVTLDVPDLLQSYLNSFPEQKKSPDLLRRMGLTFLDDGRDRFAFEAAGYLVQAYSSLSPGEDENAKMIGSEAYMALKMAIFQHQKTPLAAKVFQRSLNRICKDHLAEEFCDYLTAENLGRLAFTAGKAGSLQDALHYFDLALKKDPDHERNYYFRALVNLLSQNYEEVVSDSSAALTLNRRNRESITANLSSKDHRDWMGRNNDKAHLEENEQQYIEILSIRAKAHMLIGNFPAAKADAQMIIDSQPDNKAGYLLMFQIAERSGWWDIALKALETVSTIDTDPSRIGFYAMKIEQIKKQMRK